jgi:hypothetical protein
VSYGSGSIFSKSETCSKTAQTRRNPDSPVKNPDEDAAPDLDGPKLRRLLIHPHSSIKPAAVTRMMTFFALVY